METILTVVHLFLAIGLVGLVLIQHGKGADAGAAFGSGASATVFGSQGSANFLSRSTAVFATLFFATSLWLAYFAMQSDDTESLMDSAPVAPAVEIPAAPGVMPAVETDMPAVPEAQTQMPAATESDLPVVNTESVMTDVQDAAAEAVNKVEEAAAEVQAATEAAVNNASEELNK